MSFVCFNSQTSGNVRTEVLGGREHLVTEMIPLVGDTVMNSILYPEDEVAATVNQLDMLPAPAGHPRVNGQLISAFHPLAVNASNIGGFIKNPRRQDKKVINDFYLDTEVANGTDQGKDLIERMNSGKPVGVSTGLTLTVENSSGVGEDGKNYTAIGRNFKFDHVAILLNEKAAGAHVGTALVNEEELIVNELDTMTLEQELRDLLKEEMPTGHVWVSTVFPESKRFVYEVSPVSGPEVLFKRGYSIGAGDVVSLLDDKIEVERQVTFEPTGDNTANNKEVPVMTDPKTKPEVKEPTVNEDAAGDAPKADEKVVDIKTANKAEVFTVNAETMDKINDIASKLDVLGPVIANAETELEKQRAAVVSNNAGLTEEIVANMSVDAVTGLYNQIAPANNFTGNAAAAQKSEHKASDFVINYDKVDKEMQDAS